MSKWLALRLSLCIWVTQSLLDLGDMAAWQPFPSQKSWDAYTWHHRWRMFLCPGPALALNQLQLTNACSAKTRFREHNRLATLLCSLDSCIWHHRWHMRVNHLLIICIRVRSTENKAAQQVKDLRIHEHRQTAQSWLKHTYRQRIPIPTDTSSLQKE